MTSSRARLALLIGAAAFALFVESSQAAGPPPLYVVYDANGNLSVSLANGTIVTATSAIPPGQYWVTFDNEFSTERVVHKWHVFGSGVDIATAASDLNCDSYAEEYLGTLQPSSTYTVQDDLHPTLRVVFRTAATGTAAGQTNTPAPAAKSGPAVTNTDIVGSDVLPYRGALTAVVSASGTSTLTRNGRRVSSLKAGRYSITIVDRSPTAGFTLRQLGPSTRTIALTSAAFTGTTSVRRAIGHGRWLFSSGKGRATYFAVAA